MSASTPPYEPEVIERFAAQLDARARAIQRGGAIAGIVVGALVGAVPLTPLGDAWPIPAVFGIATLLLGALVGALIGFVVGSGRAELHRLHAQTVLCQLHAQRATLAIWKLLRDRAEAPELAASAATMRTPAPVPSPAGAAARPSAPLAAPAPPPAAPPFAVPPPVAVPEPPPAQVPARLVTPDPSPLAPPVPPQLAPPPLTTRAAG